MTAVYVCPVGQKVTVNVYGFKEPPKLLKLRSRWYFEECIKCQKPASYDYYFRERNGCYTEPGVEMEGYCELKLEEVV